MSVSGVKIGYIKLSTSIDNVKFERIIEKDYIEKYGITDDELYFFIEEFDKLFPDRESLNTYVINNGHISDGGYIPNVHTMNLFSKGLTVYVDLFENELEDIVMHVFHDKNKMIL